MAAKTLNLSTMPKYFAGTNFIPSAPQSIIRSATDAHTPSVTDVLFLNHAKIITTSDTIDRITTSAVITICMIS